MTQQEEWKPIPGFPGYEVSDLGRVISHKRGRPRVLSTPIDDNGYPAVQLWKDGQRTCARVHRLVLTVFCGPRGSEIQARHLDGDKTRSVLANLAWGSQSENMRDRQLHGADPNLLKVACPSGHPYDEANTYRSRQGKRHCRACNRGRYHARAAAARAESGEVAA